MVDIKGKEKIESLQPTRSHDVKCFKCLGYGHIDSQCPKMMIVQDAIEEIVSDSEFESVVEEEELVAHLKEGKLLVIRRNLTMKARRKRSSKTTFSIPIATSMERYVV